MYFIPNILVMKYLFVFGLLGLLFSQSAFCQSKIDSTLYKKLKEMYKDDQKWRIEYFKHNRHEQSDYDETTIQRNWAKTDSINLIEIKQIFHQYGYPGFSLVGESGSSRFWAIVQHCDDDIKFQQEVLVQMDKEVQHHNASGKNYAYLKDRVLINQGHKQLYGTQTRFNKETNKHLPFPIQDSLNVDIRRKAVGLSTLKDYLKQMDAAY